MSKPISTKIGAFWLKKDKDEKPFFSGKIDLPFPIILDDAYHLAVFRNEKKEEGSKQPDYLLYASRRDGQGTNGDSSPSSGMAF